MITSTLLFLSYSRKPNKGERNKKNYQYDLLNVNVNVFFNYLLTSLDFCKIDKNNKTLLELRSRCVNELNTLQDAGGEDDANEFDSTTAAVKTLDNDDEIILRGKGFSNDNLWSKSF